MAEGPPLRAILITLATAVVAFLVYMWFWPTMVFVISQPTPGGVVKVGSGNVIEVPASFGFRALSANVGGAAEIVFECADGSPPVKVGTIDGTGREIVFIGIAGCGVSNYRNFRLF
jgi:hypothetical protein